MRKLETVGFAVEALQFGHACMTKLITFHK